MLADLCEYDCHSFSHKLIHLALVLAHADIPAFPYGGSSDSCTRLSSAMHTVPLFHPIHAVIRQTLLWQTCIGFKERWGEWVCGISASWSLRVPPHVCLSVGLCMTWALMWNMSLSTVRRIGDKIQIRVWIHRKFPWTFCFLACDTSCWIKLGRRVIFLFF